MDQGILPAGGGASRLRISDSIGPHCASGDDHKQSLLTSARSNYSQESLLFTMPPATSVKHRRVISGPMPLLPRHMLDSIPPSPYSAKGQKAIADEYRALSRSQSPELNGLETRRVSFASHASRQPEAPLVVSRALSPAASQAAGSNSLPAGSGNRTNTHNTTTAHRRTVSEASHRPPDSSASSAGMPPGPSRLTLPRIRTTAEELRLDIGPIYQAYMLVTRTLYKQFVAGVPRTSQMFLNASKRKRDDLLSLPEEVTHAQAFEQAMKDVEVWENLFRGHCSKIRSDVEGDELVEMFAIAQAHLDSTWSSLGALTNVCDVLWTQNQQATQDVAPQDLPSNDEEIIQDIYTLLEGPATSKSNSRLSLTKNLLARIRRLSRLSKVPKTAQDSTAEDDASSLCSFTLVEANPANLDVKLTRHRRDTPDFILDPLGFSCDPYVMELNQSIRASSVISSSVASPCSKACRPEAMGSVVRDESGTILLATLHELVRLLTDYAESIEPDHLALTDAFFLFFGEFTTPHELLRLLRARYEEQPLPTMDRSKMAEWMRCQIAAKLHVVRLLATWLERHYVANRDRAVLGHIRKFALTVARDRYMPEQAGILLDLHIRTCISVKVDKGHSPMLHHVIQQGTALSSEYTATGFEQAIPVLSVAQEQSRTLVDILTFSDTAGGVEELARGLTCIESEVYHRCLPIELVVALCNVTEEQPHAVVRKMAKWSTALGLFVAKCILERRSAATRAKVFELFVEVAVVCKAMRNYSSTMSLLLSLGTRRVTRLSETMRLQLVSKRHKTMLSGMRDFFYLRGDAQDYRDDLASQLGPAVPLLSVIRSDVERIRAAHDTTQEKCRSIQPRRSAGGLIDMQMYRGARDVVRALETCYAPYKIFYGSFATRWIYSSVRPLEDIDVEDYEAKLMKMSETVEAPPPLRHRGSWVQDELWKLGNWM